MSLCLWVVRSLLRVFVGFWGGSFFFFFRYVLRNPCLVQGQGSGKTPLSEAQGCRHFIMFNFPLPTPFSAQSQGATRVPCSRVTWYRAMYWSVCHLSYFVCCIRSTLFCFGYPLPRSRRCRCGATFPPECLSFPRLTPRLADGPREVFRMTSPLC